MRRTPIGDFAAQFSVSIHASVKDATLTDLAFVPLVSVSIHASVKDATPAVLYGNPLGPVSIHASVKDATKNGLRLMLMYVFQSTHL